MSPKATQIAYSWFNEDFFYELRVMGMEGSPSPLLHRSTAGNIELMKWSDDGKSIPAWQYEEWPPSSSRIATVSVASGTVEVIKNLAGQVPTRMSFSPDGRFVAYDRPPTSDSTTHDIFVLGTEDASEDALFEHPANDYVLD